MCSQLITFFSLIQILVRSGSWGTLTAEEIRGLINDCLHSRASSTVAKYIREVRKFSNFQEINSRPFLFPENVAHLALYLSTLLRKDSKTAVLSACSALKWIHGLIPVQFNPLDFTICKKRPIWKFVCPRARRTYIDQVKQSLFRNRVSALVRIHY